MKPTHELFRLEEYTGKDGQQRKKRVVIAKGWENQDKYNNNATYYTFAFGNEKLFVKEVLAERPQQQQQGYQSQQQGYQPQRQNNEFKQLAETVPMPSNPEDIPF